MAQTQINLSNYWCPKCREWMSSEDLDERRVHRECQTKCEWRQFTPCVFACVLTGETREK